MTVAQQYSVSKNRVTHTRNILHSSNRRVGERC